MVKFAMYRNSCMLGFDGVFCKETAKAVCYTINNRPVWFPKAALKEVDAGYVQLANWFGLNDYQMNTIIPVSYHYNAVHYAGSAVTSDEPSRVNEPEVSEPEQLYTAADFPHLDPVAANLRAQLLNCA